MNFQPFSKKVLALAVSAPFLAFGCDEAGDHFENEELEPKTEEGEDRPVTAEVEALIPEGVDGPEDFKDALEPALAGSWCCTECLDGPPGSYLWRGTGCYSASNESFCDEDECFAACSGSHTGQGGRVTCYG